MNILIGRYNVLICCHLRTPTCMQWCFSFLRWPSSSNIMATRSSWYLFIQIFSHSSNPSEMSSKLPHFMYTLVTFQTYSLSFLFFLPFQGHSSASNEVNHVSKSSSCNTLPTFYISLFHTPYGTQHRFSYYICIVFYWITLNRFL